MGTPLVLPPLLLESLTPALNPTLVVDGGGLEKLSKFVSRISTDAIPTLGLDTETNITADFYWRRLRTIQVGDKNDQFIIDLLAFVDNPDALNDLQGDYGVRAAVAFKPFLDILNPILCSNRCLKVGQNLAFEYEVLRWNLGQRIWNLYSIDMAERVIYAGAMSLKNYPFFSLEQQIGRYFKMQIDKSKQKSFDLSTPLTQEQIEYAALDIRMPLAVRQLQLPILSRDNLATTTQIENDAIGSYTDMHMHGQRMDKARWLKRIENTKLKRIEDLKELDKSFIPAVGRKDEAIDETELNRLEHIWKFNFAEATEEEKAKAVEARECKDPALKLALKAELKELTKRRAERKACARANFTVLSKKRTAVRKIIEKCEGEALINYASGDQLLAAFKKMKGGLAKLEDTKGDTLLQFNDQPMIQALRRYKKGKKDTGTYGAQWTQQWVTHPCKEEGWLHPGDGRLHCVFNQLEAETGRSSSAKPNAQNLPKEDEVRACFICDPPDESIRISVCCDAETTFTTCEDCHPDHECGEHTCQSCGLPCETKAEEYCIVTVDMSGAELRIIAELANAMSWITAFNKGQDVHSVGTEILYPEKWPALACKGGEIFFDKKKGKDIILPPCAYFTINEDGEVRKQKCDCPEHKELRDGNKATNFLLCYGGGPPALADALGISLAAAKLLYKLHESKFPDIWGYLKWSGEQARFNKEARSMYGRRRLFKDPTWEGAKLFFIEDHPERLELEDDEQARNIFAFKTRELREPDETEEWNLTHREPTTLEISSSFRGMFASIERRGKNMPIQATNADIIKRAMGCGFDASGVGYLWHLLPSLKAKLLSMVHDELILQCPKRLGTQVARMVGEAFARAAAEVMTKVKMEYDFHVADRWMK